jgi:hypothetical protein
LALLTGIFLLFQWPITHYTEWCDESETVVACKMLAHGQKLYSEVFDNHGPLTFLAGTLIEKVASLSVPGHRLVVSALQLFILALAFIAPPGVGRQPRAIAAISASLGLVFIFPRFRGHTNQYDIIAGCLLAMAGLVYVFPSLLRPGALDRRRVAAGSFLIGSTAFLAVTYWPSLAMLFIAALRREHLGTALTWLAAAVAANLAWLLAIGSLSGYAADHFYFNLVVLRPYLFSAPSSLGETLSGLAAQWRAGLVAGVSAFFLLRNTQAGSRWRLLLLLTAVGGFFTRGFGFHASPAYYLMLAALAFCLALEAERFHAGERTFWGTALAALAVFAAYGPHYWAKLKADPFPVTSDFARIAKYFTGPGDKVIAYTFRNVEYLLSDRLPASGCFFYLPWQEAYNAHPVLGVKIDACRQIRQARPKVMLIDHWKVWGRYPWESYSSCIQGVADTNYAKVPDLSIYIRRDLLASDPGFAQDGMAPARREARVAGPGAPSRLAMSSAHLACGRGLERMGLMVGACGALEAELRLKSTDGTIFARRLTLSASAMGGYQWIDLDGRVYVSGEVAWVSGAKVCTFGYSDSRGYAYTCLIYKYEDGKVRFTPGCPLY